MGCTAWRSLPASAFPSAVSHSPRGGQEPINFLHLRQDPPPVHLLGPDDVLGIYIEGVLGLSDEAPPVHFPQNGDIPPAIGYPIPVREDGKLSMPFVPPIPVSGLTLAQAEEEIRKAYTVRQRILAEDRARIIVTLIRPRTYRVFVVREDTTAPGVRRGDSPGELVLGSGKRGEVHAVDLRAYENDVLHALSETGGLPGLDAKNEVTILRGAINVSKGRSGVQPTSALETPDVEEAHAPVSRLASLLQEVSDSPFQLEGAVPGDDVPVAVPTPTPGLCPCPLAPQLLPPNLEGVLDSPEAGVVKIPLRITPGMPAPEVSEEDIILNAGDVVFIESREAEVFYTGGLLRGGQFPIPRDYDLDVLGAIAMSGGSVAAGASGAGSSTSFGTGYGRGIGVSFPPTRAIVVRQVNGRQISIRVDLRRALTNPSERILVEPNDLIMLEYKPLELIANIILSNVQINYFLNSIGR
jgi:protein involved in polysaccharide export with SLBB domain